MARPLTAVLLLVLAASSPARGAELSFTHQVVDSANPVDPHCKTVGDIDGDGLLDGVVASSAGGGLYWYEYPAWTKHPIRASGSYTTDTQVGDVEPDGDLDVVTRAKSGASFVWLQGPGDTWVQQAITNGTGEGLALGDLDSDGDLDVVQDGFWSEQISPTSWIDHDVDGTWPAEVGAVVADFDGDGIPDIALGPAESAGRLSWVEAIDPVNGPWIEHVIDSTVSYLHTFKAIDVDRDGDLDLVTAEMHQSADPDEVSVYFNDGSGLAWSQLVVAGTGSHNLRVGDLGGDGDIDIFGANWNDAAPNSAVVEAWENQAAPLALDGWERHIVETALPWNAVTVEGRDLDGDGLPDLVAGGWWWPNPGSAQGLAGTWTRQTIGAPLHNVAVVHDFDNDGDLDLLGTDGQPGGEDFRWAENDGSGSFTLHDITHAAMGGDFLQGAAVRQLVLGDREEVLLSWHNGGSGTAAFTVPDDPTTAAWPLAALSATTNMEQVAVGDVDGDRDADLHLGTSWLRQESDGTFSTQSGITLSGGGVPDRVVLSDLDGDGDLDVVIGVEFADALVWGENDGSGGGWTEHAIASDFDYFSVGVADMDQDGDPDVVGGAHMGAGEVTLYENDGAGSGWTPHVVDAGDSTAIDHHAGTVLVDLDLDRDLDIISVGWSKLSLVVYENLAFDAGTSGDATPPEITGVFAWGPPGVTEVIVGFDEPLDGDTAEDPAHYALSHGLAVTGAVLAANGRSVALSTSPLAPAIEYTLSVEGVEDLAGNPIAPASMASFELNSGAPEADLVAWWPFDEGSGAVAADVSGHGHTGYLSGGSALGPSWIAGPALDFDGVDDRVEAGSFDVTGSALTLAAWIRPEAFAHCSSRDCRILSKATGTAEGDHWFMLSTIASGAETRLRFRLKTAGTTTTLIASSGDLALGEWRHAAAVYDGATMQLFLDGAPVGSIAKTGALSADSSVPVWIGGNPTDPAAKPWAGAIDDVRIYGRALEAAELLALPPPSELARFADGFESGDLEAWETSGGVEALASATALGMRGARIPVGSSCAGEETVTVEPPPAMVQGLFEACRELWVSGVGVEPPGAVFRAGERIALGEGFTAAADLALEIDPTLVPFAWLRSAPWDDASELGVELWLRIDGLTLGEGDRLVHLVGRSSAEEEAFRVILESDGAGGIGAAIEARVDGGSYATTEAVGIASGWRRLSLAWSAGAGDGRFALLVDGAPASELVGLSNAAQRAARVDWGVVGGDLPDAAGFLEIDALQVW